MGDEGLFTHHTFAAVAVIGVHRLSAFACVQGTFAVWATLMNDSAQAAATSSTAVAAAIAQPDAVASYQFFTDALGDAFADVTNASPSVGGAAVGWAMTLQCQGAVLLRFGGGGGEPVRP